MSARKPKNKVKNAKGNNTKNSLRSMSNELLKKIGKVLFTKLPNNKRFVNQILYAAPKTQLVVAKNIQNKFT